MFVLSIAEMNHNQELFLSCYKFETRNECHLKVVQYCKDILNEYKVEYDCSTPSIALEIYSLFVYLEEELNHEIEFEITDCENEEPYVLK